MAAKWGRGNLTEKFYTGSSKSNPWVKDLLWKLYIQNEGKLLRIPGQEHIDSLPAHMQSVAYAGIAGRQMLQEFDEELAAKKTLGHSHTTGQLRSEPGYSARSARSYASPSYDMPSDRYSAASGSGMRTNRSQRSSRESERADAANRRLQIVQKMLTQEQSMRKSYEKDLTNERRSRKALEKEMNNFQSSVGRNLEVSSKSRESTEAKLKAYQEIMGTLVNALEKSEKGGKSRSKRRN